MKSLKKSPVKLTASLNAVIAQFHQLPYNTRVTNIVKRVAALHETEVANSLEGVMIEFAHRHRNFSQLLMDAFQRTEKIHGDLSHFSANRKLLLGSFLTKEYAIQAAALFNPSIVAHPDQTGLKNGEQRFVMSLRATGEGHISSIIFETGIVNADGTVTLDNNSGYFTVLKKNEEDIYTKEFVHNRMSSLPGFGANILEWLPEKFTAAEGEAIIEKQVKTDWNAATISVLEDILDTNYTVTSLPEIPISEKVIFPSAKCESMGMEDLRMVKFEEDSNRCYYGTYTAYDGKRIKTQLLETTDFNDFKVRTFYGNAVNDKGMALFPQKVGGKFMMISRQGSELIRIMTHFI